MDAVEYFGVLGHNARMRLFHALPANLTNTDCPYELRLVPKACTVHEQQADLCGSGAIDQICVFVIIGKDRGLYVGAQTVGCKLLPDMALENVDWAKKAAVALHALKADRLHTLWCRNPIPTVTSHTYLSTHFTGSDSTARWRR
jgi:hypothetical protein